MNPKDKKVLLEEYRQLKSEIADWSRVRNQFIAVSLAATSALYSAAFELSNPYIFLAALFVQLPSIAICIAERQAIITIATYIQVMIEEKFEDLNWETSIQELLTHGRSDWLRSLTLGIEAFVALPPLLSLALAGAYWPWFNTASGQPESQLLAIYIGVAIAMLYALVKFLVNYSRGASLRDERLRAWRSLDVKRGAVNVKPKR